MSSSVLLETKEQDSSSVDNIDTKPSTRYPITLKVARDRVLKQLRRRNKMIIMEDVEKYVEEPDFVELGAIWLTSSYTDEDIKECLGEEKQNDYNEKKREE